MAARYPKKYCREAEYEELYNNFEYLFCSSFWGFEIGPGWFELNPNLANWVQIGSSLCQIESHFDPIMTLLDPTCLSGSPLGARPDFRDLASSEITCIVIRFEFWKFVAGVTGEPEVASRKPAWATPTRVGGQDDGSYANSLKQVSQPYVLSFLLLSFLLVRA